MFLAPGDSRTGCWFIAIGGDGTTSQSCLAQSLSCCLVARSLEMFSRAQAPILLSCDISQQWLCLVPWAMTHISSLPREWVPMGTITKPFTREVLLEEIRRLLP